MSMKNIELKYLDWFERTLQKAAERMQSEEFAAHTAIQQLIQSHLSLESKIRVLQELKKRIKSMNIDEGAMYVIREEEISPLIKELQDIEKQQLKIKWKSNPSSKWVNAPETVYKRWIIYEVRYFRNTEGVKLRKIGTIFQEENAVREIQKLAQKGMAAVAWRGAAEDAHNVMYRNKLAVREFAKEV